MTSNSPHARTTLCIESRHCTKCKCRCFSAAFYCKTRVPAIIPLPRNSAVFATAPHGSTTCLTGPAMCALRRQQHRRRHRQKRMPWVVSSHTQLFRTLGRVFERRSSSSHGARAHKSCWIMALWALGRRDLESLGSRIGPRSREECICRSPREHGDEQGGFSFNAAGAEATTPMLMCVSNPPPPPPPSPPAPPFLPPPPPTPSPPPPPNPPPTSIFAPKIPKHLASTSSSCASVGLSNGTRHIFPT